MPVRLSVELLEDRVTPAAAFQTLPILPFSNPAVLDHVRAIVSKGELQGRQVNSILKIGDSNSAPFANAPPGQYNPGLPYLTPLGSPAYNPYTSGLATLYGDLMGAWETYRSGVDSFLWQGPTAVPGWSTINVLDSLSSQVTATNAGIAFIMIGTNDVLGSASVGTFSLNLSNIVNHLLAAGVVPVLSTIPDLRFLNIAYSLAVPAFNQAIADVAERCVVPLWNVWSAINPLPNQGLDAGGVHLTTSPNSGGSFGPADLLFAQNLRNLETLQILKWFQDSVVHAPLQQIAPFQSWQSLAGTPAAYAVSRDVGFSPTVDVRDASTGRIVDRFLAFSSTFGGGVRLAMGDVNGDGVQDIVCGTASQAGVLRVFSGANGSVLFRTTPFGASFSGGVTVTTGDLNGDGEDEIVVGQANRGSQVIVYQHVGNSFTMTASFLAFPGLGTNGVSVAVANVLGLGAEIVASAMSASATVRLFSSRGAFHRTLHPYTTSAVFGLTVAAVDLDGDGFDELAVTPVIGSGGVRIIDPITGAALAFLRANPVADSNWGLRLGRIRSVGGSDTLLVGNGPGSQTSVLAFQNLQGAAIQLPPTLANRAFGIFVG